MLPLCYCCFGATAKKILKYPSGVTESGNFECWELFDGTKAKGEVETKGQTMNKTGKFMFYQTK